MTKKIPLQTWAERNYDPPPTAWVLRRWARDGEIKPAPERVGREWYVAETARRGAAAEDQEEPGRRLTLVERLQSVA